MCASALACSERGKGASHMCSQLTAPLIHPPCAPLPCTDVGHPVCSQMSANLSPAEINATREELLQERVRVFAELRPEDEPPKLPELVPYMTYGLLFRMHEAVAALNNGGKLNQPKQVVMAYSLASITGARLRSRSDAEYIGNAIDWKLRDHGKLMSRAVAASKKAAQRARKHGREPPVCRRLTELRERVYICQYGATPLKLDATCLAPLEARPQNIPIHPQPVPFRVVDVHELANRCLELKSELHEARACPSEVHVLKRNVEQACSAIDREHRLRMNAQLLLNAESERHAREVEAAKGKLCAYRERMKQAEKVTR